MAEETNKIEETKTEETMETKVEEGIDVDAFAKALGFEGAKQLSETLITVKEQNKKKEEQERPSTADLLKLLSGGSEKKEDEEGAKKEEKEKSENGSVTGTVLKEVLRRLDEEKDARIAAEAKAAAMSMGARPKLVDHLILIAKQKATADKDVISILSEIKSGELSSVYFQKEGEEEDKTDGITRGKRKTEQKKAPADYVKGLLKTTQNAEKKKFFNN